MDPRHRPIDSRLLDYCAYCGGNPDTDDQVPSKIFLDTPYPSPLLAVGACKACNLSFSLDEEYLACFVECAKMGSTAISDLRRPKIAKILSRNTSLRERIGISSFIGLDGSRFWRAETERVHNVLLKLSMGHLAFEHYPAFIRPSQISFNPLMNFSAVERREFEEVTPKLLDEPSGEIGTMDFMRFWGVPPDTFERADGWIEVQKGAYRYIVANSPVVTVKIVIGEYLASIAIWESGWGI